MNQVGSVAWFCAEAHGVAGVRMNALPKYVVSERLRTVGWQHPSIIKGNPAELKQQPGGDILLFGSADLLNSLMIHDLVDEYRLMVFPVLPGSGERLFRDATDITHLQLVDTRTFASGVAVLTYRPGDRVPSSKYVETFAWTQEQMRSWQAAQNADRVLATVMVRSSSREPFATSSRAPTWRSARSARWGLAGFPASGSCSRLRRDPMWDGGLEGASLPEPAQCL
jgi:dihydrofolate reductase